MNIIYFLTLQRQSRHVERRIVSVWESEGTCDHRQVFDGGRPALGFDSRLVPTTAIQTAAKAVDRLVSSGKRQIHDVRALLTGETMTVITKRARVQQAIFPGSNV